MVDEDISDEKKAWKEAYFSDNKKMGFLKKIKTAIFHPNDFFELVREEKIRETIKFYGILYVISLIISLVLGGSSDVAIYLSLGKTIIIFAILGLVSFLFYICIIHLFVKLLKGKGNFYDTLKVIVYSNIPIFVLDILLVPFTLFLNLIVFKSGILSFFVTRSITRAISANLLITIIIIFFLGVTLTALGYSLYLLVLGLSKYHKISKKRALLAISLSIILIIILVGVLLAGFLYVSFSRVASGLSNMSLETSQMLNESGQSFAIRSTVSGNITIQSIGVSRIPAWSISVVGIDPPCSNPNALEPGESFTCTGICSEGDEIKAISMSGVDTALCVES